MRIDSYKYGIVVDSGSSGSRLQIYKWKINGEENLLPPEIIQEQGWQLKTTPGISGYGDTVERLWPDHFSKLVTFAKEKIPEDQHSDTPIFVLATAGMRLLPQLEQKLILSTICLTLKKHSPFLIGACDDFVQIIDGSTEGIYGWLGLNYLTGTFAENTDSKSVGFMDMGGASTQIAFVPSPAEIKKHRDDLSKVTLRTSNGLNQEWDVFVQTWLGFGANEARKRYLDQLISLSAGARAGFGEISDPCLPKNCEMTHQYGDEIYDIKGLGNYDLCQKTIYPLLLKNLPCTDFPCLFNGIHVPKLNFAEDRFIGISEYWYTAQDVFNLGGDYNHATFSEKVKEFCEMDWLQILENLEQGQYLNLNPNKFLKTACFKASWVVNVLHDGFEMPKSLDLEHYPFSLANAVNGEELSWTLGKILLYASSQIPASKDTPPTGIQPSELSGGAFIPGLGSSRTTIGTETNYNILYVFVMVILFFGLYKFKRFTGIKSKLAKLTAPFIRKEHTYELADLEEGLGSPTVQQHSNYSEPLSVLRTRLTMSLAENNDPLPPMPQLPGHPGLGSRSYSNMLGKPFNARSGTVFYSFSENTSRESLHKSASTASIPKHKMYERSD